MSTDERPLILVAEDEPITSMALREQLEALDFRVLGPARDGDDAFALGVCFPVDLGLFDLRMPRRSGLDAARDLFDLAPTPVVLLTGFDAADLPDDLSAPPIFGRAAKPIGMAELRSAIDAAFVRFRDWCLANPDEDRRTASARDERTTIARAVLATADGRLLASVAADLLRRSRADRRSLLDTALALLDER